MDTNIKFKVKTLQYLSLVRYKALPKILYKLSKKNIGIILDFEDSSKDIFNAKNTFYLKNQCRIGFEYLNKLKINHPNIFIRINSTKSKHFENDIIVLKKNLNKGIKIKSIFVPKVESYNQLSHLNKVLEV